MPQQISCRSAGFRLIQIAVVALVLIAASDVRAKAPRTSERPSVGAKIYAERCASCHGDSGRGDGPVAAGIATTKMPDLTSGVYKVRSTPSGSLPTDEDIFTTLSRGHHGTAMLPWTRLWPRERWALVAHLKTLAPRFADERPARPIPVGAPPPATAERVRRGAELYQLLNCHACHGPAGQGDGFAAAMYAAHPDRPVQIRHLDRQLFLRGDGPRELFLTLRTGLDGTPMGSYDGVPDADLWSVVLYVLKELRSPPPPEPEPRATVRP